MVLPNFIIIGAAKCGTTSLYEYLNEHPDVFMSPIKETKFFSFNPESHANESVMRFPIRTLDEYEKLFTPANDKKAIGEASPQYLFSTRAVEGIQRTLPDIKLITIFRDPAEMTFSSYLAQVREGAEKRTDLGRVLDEDGIDVPLFRGSFYYRGLSRYLEAFGRDRVAIYFFEDLKSDPQRLMSEIFRFIGVDPTFTPNVAEIHNKGGVIKNQRFANTMNYIRKHPLRPFFEDVLPPRWAKKLRRNMRALMDKNSVRPELDPKLRRRLVEIYDDDIQKLAEVSGRDLGHWRRY